MQVTFLSCIFLCAASLTGQSMDGPIATPIDSWRPILPGKWQITTARFDPAQTKSLATSTSTDSADACPFPGPYLLRRHSPVKLGSSGCRFRTYRLNNNFFHIVALCRTLSGKDHQEITSLSVAQNEKSFTSVTSWNENGRSFTVRQEGSWLAPCGKD